MQLRALENWAGMPWAAGGHPCSGPLIIYTEVWPCVAGSFPSLLLTVVRLSSLVVGVLVLALATEGTLYLELLEKVSHYLDRSSQLCLGGSKADARGGGGRAENEQHKIMEDVVSAPPNSLLLSVLYEATFLGNQRCSRERRVAHSFTRHGVVCAHSWKRQKAIQSGVPQALFSKDSLHLRS